MRIFRERGVADLFRLLREEPQLLRGAFIADKVVGKGAAALMVLGGVEGGEPPGVRATRRSRHRGGIHGRGARHHEPRRDGHLPRGTALRRAETAAECLPLIEGFMQKMKEQHG